MLPCWLVYFRLLTKAQLGAFGFLSSDEVFREGVVNAGILDQHFALQWVQAYVGLFGGDPAHVTISGESAGGGSVMLQTMAYGGTLGASLFKNASTSQGGNLFLKMANQCVGYCCLAISSYAVWLQRLDPITIILCLRCSSWMYTNLGVRRRE
jgi:hypothetical protein